MHVVFTVAFGDISCVVVSLVAFNSVSVSISWPLSVICPSTGRSIYKGQQPCIAYLSICFWPLLTSGVLLHSSDCARKFVLVIAVKRKPDDKS